MKVLGVDVGTTTLSIVVTENGVVIENNTVEHNSCIPGLQHEKLQDASIILSLAMELIGKTINTYPDISCIGITGQMHGILYLDKHGNPLSPLYTWQDERGNLLYSETETYTDYINKSTGYPVATGYGLVTHFYNNHNHLVPKDASVICTIADFLAMKLAGNTVPVTDITNAFGLGLVDVETRSFDIRALSRIGIDSHLLPKVTDSPVIGFFNNHIPICLPIGDNQASYIGANSGETDKLLINIGTGSQISAYSKEYRVLPSLETRPFPGGGWLVVGAPLCGGKSYALLERFISESAYIVTGIRENAYPAMSKLLTDNPEPTDFPHFKTTFSGTRDNPNESGSITGITADSFSPLHFLYGVMYGMVEELYELYSVLIDNGFEANGIVSGAGNGLRRNKKLIQIIEKEFECAVSLSENDEEAAYGVAYNAWQIVQKSGYAFKGE